MIFEIIVLIILLIFSAFFSSAETALYSIDRIKLEKLIKKNYPNAFLIKKLKSTPDKFLITILLLNNIVNIASASIATILVMSIFPGNFSVAISTFVMTLLILIFGEITPKSFASKNAVNYALAIAPIVSFLVFIFSPITFVLEKMTFLISGSTKKENLTEDEIRTMVSIGHIEGAIDKNEKELIHNVFRLDDVIVEDVMTPRTDMVLIQKNKTLGQLKGFLKSTPYSKIPVYDKDEDDIVGIFNIRNSLNFIGRNLDIKISKLMEEPFFVPSSKKIGSLLKEFQEKKVHIAIVIGEYGGVRGVITLEDILEELVGEITEKKDDEYELKIINEKTIAVEGGTEIDLINEEFGINLKSKEYNTIAGFLLEKLDRFPKTGEKFTFDNVKIEIISAKKNKINKIKLTK
ncbi:MAG: hemolysin family protein [Candidatus ainarchaeum sp.]|nr:hemolysin family protein [Candidatus ainarchaeum sp.]